MDTDLPLFSWRFACDYCSTIKAESLEKLVTAISNYQVESLQMVAKLRKESETNAKEIHRVVEAGKKRYQETLGKFARGELLTETE